MDSKPSNAQLSSKRFSLKSLLIRAPLFAVLLAFLYRTYLHNSTAVPTKHLIKTQLATDLTNWQTWAELHRRLVADEVSKQDAEDTFELLIQRLESGTATDREYTHVREARQFVSQSIEQGLVDASTVRKLVQAWNPGPSCYPLRVHAGTRRISLSGIRHCYWESHRGGPLEIVWDITAIRLDGQHVERAEHTDKFPGAIREQLDAGKHELEVDLVCGYMPATGSRSGPLGGYLRKDLWRKTTEEWNTTLKIPLIVYPEQAPIVTLSQERSKDPSRYVRRLEVRRMKEGSNRISIRHQAYKDITDLPIGICFDRFIIVGDQRKPAGYFYCYHDPINRLEHIANIRFSVDASEFTSFDLELVPNPTHVETYTNLKEIWGKPIVIKGIKVPE